VKFNAGYYIAERIKLLKGQGAVGTGTLVVAANDAIPRQAKLSMDFTNADKMTQPTAIRPTRLAQYPQTFLFEDAKRQLSQCSFDDGDDLLLTHLL
jgi:hypothetical protein